MSKSFRHNNVFEIFSFNNLILYSIQCQNQFGTKVLKYFSILPLFFSTQCQNYQKIVRYHDHYFSFVSKK